MTSSDTLHPTSPIFIVGSPRSGTTVLAAALEYIDAGYIPHIEGHLMPWLLEGVDRVKNDKSPENTAFLPVSICHGNNFQKLLYYLAKCIDNFEYQIAYENNRPVGNGRWIDKTPDIYQLRILPTLQEVFPSSQIIFTYRHPHDVALSILNVWPGADSLEKLLQRWTDLHKEYREIIRPQLDLTRVLEIKNEDLVSSPKIVTQHILDFFNIDQSKKEKLLEFFSSAQINRSSKKVDKTFSYFNQSTPTILAAVSEICSAEMSYWGYEPIYLDEKEIHNTNSVLLNTETLNKNPLKCWCLSIEFLDFSSHYLRCKQCGSLVSKSKSLISADIDDRLVNFTFHSRPNVSNTTTLPNTTISGFFSAAGPIKQPITLPEKVRQEFSKNSLRYLGIILKYKLPPSNILVVGSTASTISLLLRWVGYKVTEFETYQDLALYLQENFNTSHVSYIQTKVNLKPDSLDLILFVDFIEFLLSPVTELKQYLAFLKNDGVLLVKFLVKINKKSFEELLIEGHRYLSYVDKGDDFIHLFSEQAAFSLFKELKFFQIETEFLLSEDMLCLAASNSTLHRHKLSEAIANLPHSPTNWLIFSSLDFSNQTHDIIKKISTDLSTINNILQAKEEELASIKPVLQAKEDELASLKDKLSTYERSLLPGRLKSRKK